MGFKKIFNMFKVNEGFFDKKADIEKNILTFDVMPNAVDVGVNRWILRLSLYGKLYYHYKDSGSGENRDCNLSTFIDKFGDKELLKTLGNWEIEKKDDATVLFWREYWGPDGEQEVEELEVFVDLRPEVKKILKNYK